ncbi:MAG: 3-keto-5-aminohexanoate cleavage protein [Lachnospiraceae bacterium]|nr:3-keto-5-aminohexanoate cleavage protein [Lachnospiraceae bacterium]
MKINIYYGGRGLLDDPTIYVINKMTEVLEELRVKVERFNIYEQKNSISTLPQTLKDADGVIFATTVEWLGIGGYMHQFLDACWLYADKEKIKNLYMQPVVMSTTYGEREAYLKHFDLINNDEDIVELLKEFDANEVKPEWEMYNLTDIKRLRGIIDKGVVKGPHWCMMLFGGNGVFPNYDAMALAMQMLPPDAIFSCINIGGAHTAMLTQAIIMGNHVRVGLEDVVYYGPGEPVKSNAQLVERAVRIAEELGRPIATPAQAREMLGLGAPRQY